MEEANEKEVMSHLINIFIPFEPKNPNNAYHISGNAGKGFKGMFMKADYKNYKTAVIDIAKKAIYDTYGLNFIPTTSDILIRSTWTFGTLRRKDLQNCGKLEYDALNGVVYEDDSQIVDIIQQKRYKKNEPSVLIEVFELKNSYFNQDIENENQAKKKTKKNKRKSSKEI